MLGWIKNKKNKNNKNSKKVVNEKPKVVSQQKSQFDVEPAFFNYDKIKTNIFLTDDGEYNKKKLIDNLPNGDASYLNIDENKVEIEARRQKDEAAFREITTNLNHSYLMSENNIKNIKTQSISNIKNISEDDIYPIKSRQINEKFYSKVAKGLNEQYKHISKETSSFLKEMHTKILNTNNLNEPLVNSNENFEMGGRETSKEWISTDSGVNRYENLVKARNDLLKQSNDYQPSKEDFDSLNNIPTKQVSSDKNLFINNSVTYQDELIEKHSKNIDNEYVGERNGKLFTGVLSNSTNSHRATINLGLNERAQKTRQINELANNALNKTKYRTVPMDYTTSNNNFANAKNIIENINETISPKTSLMKNNDVYITKPLHVEQYPEYNDMLINKMTKEINDHLNTRTKITTELEEASRSKNHIYTDQSINMSNSLRENDFDIEKLIPVNEVKMDLRTRKSQKKVYEFNNRGCF